jgi:hypothetical protein
MSSTIQMPTDEPGAAPEATIQLPGPAIPHRSRPSPPTHRLQQWLIVAIMILGVALAAVIGAITYIHLSRG